MFAELAFTESINKLSTNFLQQYLLFAYFNTFRKTIIEIQIIKWTFLSVFVNNCYTYFKAFRKLLFTEFKTNCPKHFCISIIFCIWKWTISTCFVESIWRIIAFSKFKLITIFLSMYLWYFSYFSENFWKIRICWVTFQIVKWTFL